MTPLDALLARLFLLHRKDIELTLGRMERLLGALGSPERNCRPSFTSRAPTAKARPSPSCAPFSRRREGASMSIPRPILSAFTSASASARRAAASSSATKNFCGAKPLRKGQRRRADHLFRIHHRRGVQAYSAKNPPITFSSRSVSAAGATPPTSFPRRAATVVTSISIDHTEFLGPTVAKIAYEKAGIFKPAFPPILGVQQDEAHKVLRFEAARVGAPAIDAARDFSARAEHGRLIFEDARGLLDLPLPRLPGRHQHENAATAIAALRCVEPDLARAPSSAA